MRNLKIPKICPECIAEVDIICPRDVDVRCLECGTELCGGHISEHLKGHCITMSLDHCTKAGKS